MLVAAVSVVVLHGEPPDEMDLTFPAPSARVTPEDVEVIKRDIRQIKDSLGGMNIVAALDNLERRLSKAEIYIKNTKAKSKRTGGLGNGKKA